MRVLIFCLYLMIPLSTVIKADTSIILIDDEFIVFVDLDNSGAENASGSGDDDGIEPEDYPW